MQHIFLATKNELNMKEIHYTDTIHYELEQTAKLMRKLSMQILNKLEINISVDECAALDIISCNENICQRDLAKKILKDRANTGRILNSLEEKGFIKRSVDTKNNRLVKKIEITKIGKSNLNEITNKIRSYIEGVSTAIPHSEVMRIRDVLKNFRIDLEKVVEINI